MQIAVARNLDNLPENLTDANRLSEITAGTEAVMSAFGPSSSSPRYTTNQHFTDQLVGVAVIVSGLSLNGPHGDYSDTDRG